jgi:hypothetical protein
MVRKAYGHSPYDKRASSIASAEGDSVTENSPAVGKKAVSKKPGFCAGSPLAASTVSFEQVARVAVQAARWSIENNGKDSVLPNDIVSFSIAFFSIWRTRSGVMP